MIPHASRIYGKTRPKLYFYTEAYNFAWEGKAKGSAYQVSYRIDDIFGKNVLTLQGRKKKKPGPSSVINGALDVSTMASGAYHLQLTVTDLFTKKLAVAKKDFMIYNKADFLKTSTRIQPEIAVPDTSKYLKMDEEALDLYFQQVGYICTPSEKKDL
ncbi:MAG: hypothetical protein ACT6FF_05245 [Methanosarcinaceae archaeon]